MMVLRPGLVGGSTRTPGYTPAPAWATVNEEWRWRHPGPGVVEGAEVANGIGRGSVFLCQESTDDGDEVPGPPPTDADPAPGNVDTGGLRGGRLRVSWEQPGRHVDAGGGGSNNTPDARPEKPGGDPDPGAMLVLWRDFSEKFSTLPVPVKSFFWIGFFTSPATYTFALHKFYTYKGTLVNREELKGMLKALDDKLDKLDEKLNIMLKRRI